MSDKNGKIINKAYLEKFWDNRVKEMPKHTKYTDLNTNDQTIIGAINELKKNSSNQNSNANTYKELYGGNITINELNELTLTQQPIELGTFYSVYRVKETTLAKTIYVGDFIYNKDLIKGGTFLKWNGSDWVYDTTLGSYNFKTNALYSREYNLNDQTNDGQDCWACIWQWDTNFISTKSGATFCCKAICNDQREGYTTQFTVETRLAENNSTSYSYIDCEFLTPQLYGNTEDEMPNYWGDNPSDLRTFIRVTIENDTYRVYARLYTGINGFSGINFLYPAFSIDDTYFKEPMEIEPITWSNHIGNEITQINYGVALCGDDDSDECKCNTDNWVQNDFPFDGQISENNNSDSTNEEGTKS